MHRRFATAAAVSLLFGVICIAAQFDPNSPWFYLGLVGVNLAGQSTVCSYFAAKRATLDDAYSMGFDAGLHKGQRVKPKVIRLPTERRREPSSRPSPTRD